MSDAHCQTHLNRTDRVNLGSFYTPEHIVDLVAVWLKSHLGDKQYTIFDPSCGYGAFFKLRQQLPQMRYRGNDIDPEAVSYAAENYTFAQITCRSALRGINRKNFGISRNEMLVIVGNPPYNDTTSQSGQRQKNGRKTAMDDAVKSRDLGISSLLAYNILQAKYVAILHPLAYLTKATNFKSASPFFNNYRILEHRVFSSSEFAGTSGTCPFPVIVALYQRTPGRGIKDWRKIHDFTFNTMEGNSFSLSQHHFLDNNIICKYPHRERFQPEILFYTLRDLNALMRSRTFLTRRTANAVDVPPELLPYYCYIDCFKRYAKIPYFMGNMDVPWLPDTFNEMTPIFTADAQAHHPEIFGKTKRPTVNNVKLIRKYIQKAITGIQRSREKGKDNGAHLCF